MSVSGEQCILLGGLQYSGDILLSQFEVYREVTDFYIDMSVVKSLTGVSTIQWSNVVSDLVSE